MQPQRGSKGTLGADLRLIHLRGHPLCDVAALNNIDRFARVLV